MKKSTGFFAFLTLSLAATACSSADSDGSAVAKGSVAQGDACRSTLDCAAVEGRSVKCDCSDAANVPICLTLQKAGESCAITGNFQPECEPGTGCVSGLNMTDATCQPVATLGEACGGTTNASCLEELSCVSEVCSAGTGTLGTDCFNDGDCGANYRCDFMTGCVERIAIGQSCADAGIPTIKTCVDGAGCDTFTHKCVTLKSDGEDCFEDAECNSGVCSLGGCGANYRIPSSTSYQCGF